MFRKFVVLAALGLTLAGWASAAKPDASPDVTILTQNMDDGTDQTFIIGALMGALPLPDAVDLTLGELMAGNFPGRAEALAAKIAELRPQLVALQEAALWRTGATPDTATTVLFDNVELLLSALRAHGVAYDVVAVNRLSDIALPGSSVALRFTDRNALLVRSDLRPPRFHLSDVHARTFDAALPFAGLNVTAGWISADVHMGNRKFRFVTTHLESPIPGDGHDASVAVQVAQAKEMVHELRNLTIPVVICGDFNSDATHLGPVDVTPTVDLIEASGYQEAWPAANGGDPGLTWPYYLEDQFPPADFFAPSIPLERIDLFFSKGMAVGSVNLVVAPIPGMPPYASDHAGVLAVFHP